MFGIDWNLDGDVDIIDDLLTLELLSEDDEEDDDNKQIVIVEVVHFTYNRIKIQIQLLGLLCSAAALLIRGLNSDENKQKYSRKP